MNLRKNMAVVFLGVSMLASGCGNQKTTEQSNYKNQEVVVDEEQSKLDVLQPSVYGNVNGLTLEPGSSISIIGRGKDTAYWDAVKAGAKKAVEHINKQLGYKGEDKVKLVYSGPSEEGNVDEQVNILDEELARYPAAVGIAAVDMNACEVQFDLAKENNIPIVAFDAGTDYQDIVSLVKTDDAEAAKMAANKLADFIEEEGEVLIVAHDTTSMTAIDRETAFTAQMEEKYPNVTVVDSYHLDECKKRAKALVPETNEESVSEESEEEPKINIDSLGHQDIIKAILEEHPNVKAIYTTSESAAKAVVSTLDELENTEIQVVSFDGGEDQIERLKEGKISGIIMQNPYGMGYATVVAASRAILGLGNEAVVDTGYTWVTPKNLEHVSIQNMLY